MFTGIVEEVGTVRYISCMGTSGQIGIQAERVLEGTRTGDSIAVNGVCLTVTAMSSGGFTADFMAETARRSNLGSLKTKDAVNLERAMPADGRFGGHIVSGHIDGTGEIKSVVKEENAVWITVGASREVMRLIVEKGSICIDGISLTVAGVSEKEFKVSVIPHTGRETALLMKKAGDMVNLENDVIGKYVERLLSSEKEAGGSRREDSDGITMEFLLENEI